MLFVYQKNPVMLIDVRYVSLLFSKVLMFSNCPQMFPKIPPTVEQSVLNGFPDVVQKFQKYQKKTNKSIKNPGNWTGHPDGGTRSAASLAGSKMPGYPVRFD